MKKFFKYIVCFCLFFFSSQLSSASSKQKEILDERKSDELEVCSYRLNVEQEAVKHKQKQFLSALLLEKKYKLLFRSSAYLKKHCFIFDDECRKSYGMFMAYLKALEKKADIQNMQERKELEEAHKRYSYFRDKIDSIESDFTIADHVKYQHASLLEMRHLFTCVHVHGWNKIRGVFVPESNIFTIKGKGKVIFAGEKEGTGFLSIKLRDGFTIHFAYIESPLVEKGETISAGRVLFDGSQGNFLRKNSVLVFLTKDEMFVDPTFMCR